MSQVNFANATIDHLRGYGIRMQRDEWHAVRVWLEKSAEELEEWARGQALEEAARIADDCVRDECSPRFVANRIRDRAKLTKYDPTCRVCHYVHCVCPR